MPLPASFRAAFHREHSGPPRLPRHTWRDLYNWGMDLLTHKDHAWPWSAERETLIVDNAASWVVWSYGGGKRGMAGLTVWGEQQDRGLGAEVALEAVERIYRHLEQTATEARPLRLHGGGRAALGADNLTSLMRSQWRKSYLNALEQLGRAAPGTLPDDRAEVQEPAFIGNTSVLVWVAGVWFHSEWEQIEPQGLLPWLEDWLGALYTSVRVAPAEGAGPVTPRQANWRHEAKLQVQWRVALCLGLDVWLEARVRGLGWPVPDPLPAPDQAPAALRQALLTLLRKELIPAALRLLEESDLDVSPAAREALCQVLGLRPNGHFYRVDHQRVHFPGHTHQEREQALLDAVRVLGALFARRHPTEET